MNVHPFSLSSLDRVHRTDWDDSAALPKARLLRGSSRAIRVGTLGSLALTLTDAILPEPPSPDDNVWIIRRHDEQRAGFLILSAMSGMRVVARTLGIPSRAVLGRLRSAERGIATATIASVLRSLGLRASIQLERCTWSSTGLIRLLWEARYEQAVEHLRLDVPPHWLPESDPAAAVGWLSENGPEYIARIELARTRLPYREWTEARLGDAVVFGVPAIASDGIIRAHLTCGPLSAPAEVEGDGTIRLSGALQKNPECISATRPAVFFDPGFAEKATADKECDSMTNEDTSPAPLNNLLATAPIEVVAELGRLVLRADEVATLRAGSVLSLGHLRSDLIELRVGDRAWAVGELVDVDGELGVRLTSMRR